jgi:hypothetical protein
MLHTLYILLIPRPCSLFIPDPGDPLFVGVLPARNENRFSAVQPYLAAYQAGRMP